MADLGINKVGQIQTVKVAPKEILKEQYNKPKKSTVKKVAMAGLAAAGAIGMALLAIKKGNANAVKEFGIDAFKEAGNSFVKGKAVTAEGKPFTGIVNTIGKDGSKHSLEYVNGVLKESVKSARVNIGGKTEYIEIGKKGYNYNAQGKLETVDNFSRVHVTSIDPSQSGLQYVKTKTVNIEAQKAEGLERHAQKQAAKKAEEEARVAAEKAEAEAKELARKQAKREEMLKLKEENPAEYKRLQVERKKARHAEQVAQRTRTVTPNENPDIDFKRVINETSEGRVIREYSLEDGKLLCEYRVDKYGDRLNTVSFADDTKIITGYNNNGNQIEKLFVKNDKGEYELLKRIKDDGFTRKTVERLEDGTTMVTKETHVGKNIVIRDKKGNILFEKDISKGEGFVPPAKLKAPWFNHYEQLCKKFGVSARPCGVKGGAGDHYYELCLRESNPAAYERYLSNLERRARYSESEQILESLNNGAQYVFA